MCRLRRQMSAPFEIASLSCRRTWTMLEMLLVRSCQGLHFGGFSFGSSVFDSLNYFHSKWQSL